MADINLADIKAWRARNGLGAWDIHLMGDSLTVPISDEECERRENDLLETEDEFDYLNISTAEGEWIVQDDEVADPCTFANYIVQSSQFIDQLIAALERQ